MKTRMSLLLCLFALCWLPAHAGTILYTENGTFSATTPSSAYSGPSETWAFSFLADSNPTILDYGNGGFDFAFSHFNYWLNGSPVAITPTAIRFFTSANGGGFFMCLGPLQCGHGVFPNGLGTGPPFTQLYSGPNSAPTLLTGIYPFQMGVAVNSNGYDAGNGTLLASTVPEPSSLMLIGSGVLGLAGVIRRKLTV